MASIFDSINTLPKGIKILFLAIIIAIGTYVAITKTEGFKSDNNSGVIVKDSKDVHINTDK